MSAHAPAAAPHAAPAPHAAAAAAPHGAPHATPHVAPAGPSYLRSAMTRFGNGVKNLLWGPMAELGKGVYDVSAQPGHEWDNSVLAPIGSSLVSAVGRPFMAAKTLVHHDGHWGFNPGKAIHELGDWVEDPLHQVTRFGTRAISAFSGAVHRMSYGAGQLLRSVGGQTPEYSTASTFAGLPMDSSAVYTQTWA